MKFKHETKSGIRINRPHGAGEFVFRNCYCLLPDGGDPRDREFLEGCPGVVLVEPPAELPELKQDAAPAPKRAPKRRARSRLVPKPDERNGL